MTINEYLKRQIELHGDSVDHLVFRDGLELSVHAGRGWYCDPENSVGPWTHVEVCVERGNPPRSFRPYYNGGVYGMVPVEIVDAVIKRHGGIV